MSWVVDTDAALARILGVSRPAVVKAEARGKIGRRLDNGLWDVWGVIEKWRHSTMPTLQRPLRGV